MKKNKFLKLLSCVLGIAVAFGSLSTNADAKSYNSLTSKQKILVGVGVGGSVLLVAGITLLSVFSGESQAKSSENSGSTNNKHGNKHSGRVKCWYYDPEEEEAIYDPEDLTIFDYSCRYTHAEVLEANLNNWFDSHNKSDKNALFAALNMYSLQVFGKKHNEVVADFKKRIGTNKLLFNCCWVLENHGDEYYPKEDERKCVLDICKILSHFEKDSRQMMNGTDEKYHRINMLAVAEVVTPILESKPESLSDEMRRELEVLKKGKWFDYCSGWKLNK